MARYDEETTEMAAEPPDEMVRIYRRIPVAEVGIEKGGNIPFEAAVLIELGQRLSHHPDESVVNIYNDSMHDRYEASWQGRSVVVKLGDFATEDQL